MQARGGKIMPASIGEEKACHIKVKSSEKEVKEVKAKDGIKRKSLIRAKKCLTRLLSPGFNISHPFSLSVRRFRCYNARAPARLNSDREMNQIGRAHV